MRKWIVIAAVALAALSCSREMEQNFLLDEPEGQVEITFSVTGNQETTKALGEEPQLESMYIAVFGGSGYLKEYVTAELKSKGTYLYKYEDNKGETIEKEVPEYTYSARITLSNTPRRIHFLGNGPTSIRFGKDYEV